MSEDTQPTPAGRWLTFRPGIKVLDCTIRDGGLMNDHKFDDDVVKAVYDAMVKEKNPKYLSLKMYSSSEKKLAAELYRTWVQQHSAFEVASGPQKDKIMQKLLRFLFPDGPGSSYTSWDKTLPKGLADIL